MNTKIAFLLIVGLLTNQISLQAQSDIAFPVTGHWRTSNAFYVGWSPGPGSIPGPLEVRNDFATNNAMIDFFTNNILRATITTNNALVNTSVPNFNFNTPAQAGDGIRILAGVGSNPAASIDIFTSGQNQTFLRMDGTALLQTTNNRFENISNLNGFWYNVTGNGANGAPGPFTPQYIWNIQQQERGRLGSNGWWRFGGNAGNVNANNIVEIRSQATSPYGVTGSGLRFSGLTSAVNPIPNGVNGVNSQNALTVDQNGDVVLTAVAAAPTANQGLIIGPGNNVQLGNVCPNAAPMFGNRAINMNNGSFHWQNGRVGFGTACAAGNRVEITGLQPSQSGLRFSLMTSTNTPQANPGQGVLALDQQGDVIYVPDALSNINGNQGISLLQQFQGGPITMQLGVLCSASNNEKNANSISGTPRVIRLNTNFIFGDGGNLGVGFPMAGPNMNCTVANKVEIASTTGNPYHAGILPGPNGASGLRLRHLTSTVTPVANGVNGVNNLKLLSVDQSGDVVLVNAPTGGAATGNNGLSVNGGVTQLGVSCPTNAAGIAAAQLLNDRQVPMNNFNFVFTNAGGGFTPGTNGVGIGTGCVPGNRLEVDRNTGNNNPTSGLRLTQFQTGVTPLPTNNMALSVNGSGDVILTSITGGGTPIGNYCTPGPPNPLTGEFEIPLGTFKYRFTGQSTIQQPGGTQQDMVSIGYNCGSALPPSKLSVREAQTATPAFDTYAGYFVNQDASAGNNGETIAGVFGEATGATPINLSEPINAGGVFEGRGTIFNIGVIGRNAKSSKPNLLLGTGGYAIGGAFMSDTVDVNGKMAPTDNIGVFARGKNTGAANNYGVYAVADGKTSGFVTNYGVYAEADYFTNNAASYGIYARSLPPQNLAGPNYAGFFDGDVVRTGNDNFGSDQMLKQNIDTIANAIGIINQLKPKTFAFKTNTYPQMALPSGQQFGLIAQDVQTLVPALVNTVVHPPSTVGNQTFAAFSYKTLEYQQLIPIIIRAMQQQQIQALTQIVNNCCNNNDNDKQAGTQGNGSVSQQQIANLLNVDLSDKDVIVLQQNVPNPFAEHTTITYNIPQEYKFAQIIFKTTDGKIIKAVDIEKKGRGQLNVFASDLSNGMYMYTLIVDGKVFDTKKMMKQ